ncbi:MAG: type VI secretion system tube protein Hcp [Gemmatimonadota bacterium]|nr:MAG: type VI secretion system tube protein Hcp [Gemmatimonadota bacterium]
MSRKRSAAVLAVIVIGVLAVTAAVSSRVADGQQVFQTGPTVKAFLTLTEIEGGATERAHAGSIEVLAFNWGLENAVPRAGAQMLAGVRPEFGDLVITKPLDKSSPILAVAAAEGRMIQEAELVFYAQASDSEPAGTIKLTGVRVRAVESGTSSATGLTESVGLAFSRIEWTFNATDARGGTTRISSGWDLETNRRM